MVVWLGWWFVFTTLCLSPLPATAIQPTRRLALPIFSDALPSEIPEPKVTNTTSVDLATKSDSSLATDTTLSVTDSFLLLTLPSLKTTARERKNLTTRKAFPTSRMTRRWKPTRLPPGNWSTPRRKFLTTKSARITLPFSLPVFTGPAQEVETAVYTKPAVDYVSPTVLASEADGTLKSSHDRLPVLSVVQTTAAVLTAAGEFLFLSETWVRQQPIMCGFCEGSLQYTLPCFGCQSPNGH
jgi:hypothetical protein